MEKGIKLIECPRDAMQGVEEFIPTDLKVKYINKLLEVGFDTIDFGSFVSPKAIPQLKDTEAVLAKLNLENTKSKLLAIVANERGAKDASNFEEINYLGYPFSVSETFQKRNTNASIEESLTRVELIQNLCLKNNKELVIYLSMGFGNPYGDKFHEDILAKLIDRLGQIDIKIFAPSDTIGVSEPEIIKRIYSTLIPEFPNYEIGAHLHTTSDKWEEKVNAAFLSGCIRFDGAMGGLGGCPMAEDTLTGNMPTENLIQYFEAQGVDLELDINAFKASQLLVGEVFP